METSEALKYVADEAHSIYQRRISKTAQKFGFTPEPTKTEISQAPMVLVIGNHSSGKSSFLNQLVGIDVQRTALAPMDDGFTILSYGDEAEDIDGHAVVTNQDSPFQGLENFGQTLVSHVVLKRRPSKLLRNIRLIDSPGMIDSRLDHERGVHDRGYDFIGVVRWFAERSDVILLFFDPDNPGTTGETLRVLNEALRDLDHKLELIMNKVDRFESHHDFARGYGALCWNLARALPKLDLPHINLIYLKGHTTPKNHLPLEDFDRARQEVIEKVKNAPAKRIDNIVTRLYEFGRFTKMHATILNALGRKYRLLRLQLYSLIFAVLLLGVAATVTCVQQFENLGPALISVSVCVLVLIPITILVSGQLNRAANELIGQLDETFEECYRGELAIGSNHDDLRLQWRQVRPRIEAVYSLLGAGKIPALSRNEIRELDSAIETDLPGLRAEVHSQKTLDPVARISK